MDGRRVRVRKNMEREMKELGVHVLPSVEEERGTGFGEWFTVVLMKK